MVLLAVQPFVAFGSSHLGVLALTVVGAAGWIVLGRTAGPQTLRVARWALAAVVFGLNLGYEIWVFDPAHPGRTLPLELSDLAPYVAAYALCSGRQWAFALSYYWCLVLSVQALVTPALSGPDFPSGSFLIFFANHVFVVWAAIFLTWGLRRRPTWRDYGITVAATVCWAVPTEIVNKLTGSNYGFLDHKPPTASLLDLFGPWPWYLVVETVLVLAVWALITLPWTRMRAASGSSETASTRERVDRPESG